MGHAREPALSEAEGQDLLLLFLPANQRGLSLGFLVEGTGVSRSLAEKHPIYSL